MSAVPFLTLILGLVLGFMAGVLTTDAPRRTFHPRNPLPPVLVRPPGVDTPIDRGEVPEPPRGGAIESRTPFEFRGTVPPPPFIVHLWPRGHVGNPHGWKP